MVPPGWSIQSIACTILKLNELLKMVEPFSSILHQIRQNLAQNSYKLSFGIMETRDFEILTIICGMILKEKLSKLWIRKPNTNSSFISFIIIETKVQKNQL